MLFCIKVNFGNGLRIIFSNLTAYFMINNYRFSSAAIGNVRI